jgi:hypothetical protein
MLRYTYIACLVKVDVCMLVSNLGAQFLHHITLRYNGQLSYYVLKISIAHRDFTELLSIGSVLFEGVKMILNLWNIASCHTGLHKNRHLKLCRHVRCALETNRNR